MAPYYAVFNVVPVFEPDHTTASLFSKGQLIDVPDDQVERLLGLGAIAEPEAWEAMQREEASAAAVAAEGGEPPTGAGEEPFPGASAANVADTLIWLEEATDDERAAFIEWERARPAPRVTILRELGA